MFPQQHRCTDLSTFQEQRAPLTSDQRQHSPSMNADRMETFAISNNENDPNTSGTRNVVTGNHNEEGNNTTNRVHDPLEMLISLTDAILIIGALIVVISVFVTFSIVGLAIFQIPHINHTNNHTLPLPWQAYNEIYNETP